MKVFRSLFGCSNSLENLKGRDLSSVVSAVGPSGTDVFHTPLSFSQIYKLIMITQLKYLLLVWKNVALTLGDTCHHVDQLLPADVKGKALPRNACAFRFKSQKLP